MEETKSNNKQLCHDLRPLFEGTRPPLKLKKVRKRLQAQPQSVAVERLIATHGLEKLSSLTKRLVNEGSLRCSDDIEKAFYVARNASWSLEQTCYIIDRIPEKHHAIYCPYLADKVLRNVCFLSTHPRIPRRHFQESLRRCILVYAIDELDSWIA
jgi:hypothetical protein